MADDSITACGEVRLETRAQEPHAPPVEPPPVPVVVPDDQPNEPQEREEPEPEEEEPEPLPPAAAHASAEGHPREVRRDRRAVARAGAKAAPLHLASTGRPGVFADDENVSAVMAA